MPVVMWASEARAVSGVTAAFDAKDVFGLYIKPGRDGQEGRFWFTKAVPTGISVRARAKQCVQRKKQTSGFAAKRKKSVCLG
jgi:hypothetical protein